MEGEPTRWLPSDHRVGHLHFSTGPDRKQLRAVHLRSYSFLIAFSDPGGGRTSAIDFDRAFLATAPGVKPLPASRSVADLVCDGIDAWSSWESSRASIIA